MNAAALLGLSAKQKTIEEFRLSERIQLSVVIEPAQKHDAAVIFGGDGTVHRHLPRLHQQKIPTLVVPTGSGNDFAKALGIRSVDIALRAWQQFCTERKNGEAKNVKEIDLGVIRSGSQEKLFCCVAGVGMDAEANVRANRMPLWIKSRGGYVLAALQSLIAFKPAEMTISAEGREIRRSAFFIAVGNALSYGGGMKVTPQPRLMTDCWTSVWSAR